MAFESKYLSVEQYLRRLSGLDKEVLLVDHNYVKAWNAHPDSHRTKPAHLLFMKGLQRYPLSDVNVIDEDVDVESVDEPITNPFDNPKSKVLPSECERNLRNTQLFRETEQEDFDLSKFSSSQRKLYQQVMNVLYDDKLAKLCHSGSLNEPLKRRISLDKAARQMRQIFGLVFWNMDLLSWLHKTLLNNLEVSTLSIYIDVLQTLKAKVPTLVDRVLQSCAGTTVGDAVIQIFKKSWDPVSPILNQNKPKKLPGNAIILICPSRPNQGSQHSPRLRYWLHNLGCLCKVLNLASHHEEGKDFATFEESLEHLMASIRNKVIETKNHYPNRPLILLGWTLGALLACHIALQEPVDGVICLGFPLTGVNGSRGDLNDPLLDNKVPTLFVVGQNAYMCSTDDMEDFRSRMRAETGLVVVGGADDLLRMCPAKMKCESVTQSIVDRCIVDEISEFLTSIVVKLPSTSSAATPTIASKPCTPIIEEEDNDRDATWLPDQEGKRRRRKPREYSPELSPVRKRQKHHLARQSTSSKYRLSPTSSENSSCGSEKATVTKPTKKSPEKRMGRPTSSPWRKRNPGRPVASPALVTSLKKTIPSYTPEELEYPPTKTPTSEPKSILPFSKNILPKKNEIVDVNAAFGSDSSFLPRPLTPPEPEDTVSAEETERVLAELEGKEAEGNAAEEPQPSSSITSITSWLNDALLDKPFAPITSDVEKETTPLPTATTLPTVVSVQPPTVTTTEERRPITLASLLSQGKTINSNAIQSLKTSGGISLLTNTQVSPTKTAINIVPSSSASISTTSSLLTGLRTQGGKMIQIVTKPKEQTSQPQSFQTNLSLLSDVAGTRKAEATATLVKLDRPSPFQSVKCVKVIKSISSPSPPSRIETAEEMVEKQLAIQALNKSIGIESSSSLGKESGYSICYAKADGSIVSRSVTRPSYPGLISQGRGRGVRHQFPSTTFRFSHK